MDTTACGHDDHLHEVHVNDGLNERLKHAEQLCATSGARLTPLRSKVLQLILTAKVPMGAYDLLAQLGQKDQRPAAPPTVYRALDFLLAQGLVHRLSSINAYIPCCHPREGHQAVFLICQNCHLVQEASANGVFSELFAIAQKGHFSAAHSMIEVSGLCQHCQNQTSVE